MTFLYCCGFFVFCYVLISNSTMTLFSKFHSKTSYTQHISFQPSPFPQLNSSPNLHTPVSSIPSKFHLYAKHFITYPSFPQLHSKPNSLSCILPLCSSTPLQPTGSCSFTGRAAPASAELMRVFYLQTTPSTTPSFSNPSSKLASKFADFFFSSIFLFFYLFGFYPI